ncbi:hypothetical protein CGZ80_03110 [Rhodopirellula sp. MGV]|nr:hypothetical protein CGZ80_03110 [Rhodopirellula sp. MGV]PNY38558.1 hypothetical protein C2E31_01155 [Rhodopirellula baltica]
MGNRLGSLLMLAGLGTTSLVGCGTPDATDAAATAESQSESAPNTTDLDATAQNESKTPEPAQEPLPELPAGEAEDGGYTIAQVMQLAHDNKLYRRLFDQPADPEVIERMKLLYAELPKRQPPKGDPEQWQERSTALVEAVVAIEAGNEQGIAMLKRAANCSSCHGRHRES